jgi:hypothetical protein
MENMMIRTLSLIFAVAATMAAVAPNSQAGVQVGVSADDDGVKGFYLAIGEQYRVPEREVVVVRERNIPDDELPVVFFLARHANVEPGLIVNLRLGGESWMDIALQYHLSPEIFYVNFDRDPGPPYGKAWGYYKNHKHNEWKDIRLVDVDIVNIVNLKFVSERYGCTPVDVVKMRARGDNFVFIHKQVKGHKAEKNNQKAVASSEHDQDHGKSHSKGKHK